MVNQKKMFAMRFNDVIESKTKILYDCRKCIKMLCMKYAMGIIYRSLIHGYIMDYRKKLSTAHFKCIAIFQS